MVAVKNCLVQHNDGYGINFSNVYNSSVASSVIDDNLIGINIFICHNTSILKNTVKNNTNYGIGVGSSQNSLVKQNTITGNGTEGLYHFSTGIYGNVFSNNTISGNTNFGVYVSAGSPTFSKNLIDGNGNTGFFNAWDSYSTIIGNTISNNTGYCITVYNSGGYLSKKQYHRKPQYRFVSSGDR